MKKILLFTLFLSSISVFAQNYSTGTITLTSGYTVKFDTNSTTVTMTLVGPSDKWLGLGFMAIGYMGQSILIKFIGKFEIGTLSDGLHPSKSQHKIIANIIKNAL